jgi:hypothetical protein
MKKFQIGAMALFAVLALTAMFSSVASAATTLPAEWLFNGGTVTSELLVNVSGELLLLETQLGVDILCSGLFEGTVGPGAADLITLVEELEGEHKDVVQGNGGWVNCFIHEHGSCEEANETLVMVFPLHLPWTTLVELIVNEKGEEVFVDLIVEGVGGKPGYLTECKLLGIKGDAECVGTTGALLSNGTSDVTSNFLETDLIVTERAKCKTPLGGGEGVLESKEGLTEDPEGTLSVSSP